MSGVSITQKVILAGVEKDLWLWNVFFLVVFSLLRNHDVQWFIWESLLHLYKSMRRPHVYLIIRIKSSWQTLPLFRVKEDLDGCSKAYRLFHWALQSLRAPLVPPSPCVCSVSTALDSGASPRPDALLYQSAAVTITSLPLAAEPQRGRGERQTRQRQSWTPLCSIDLQECTEEPLSDAGLSFPRAGLECQTWIDCLDNAAGKFGTVGLSVWWIVGFLQKLSFGLLSLPPLKNKR